MSSTDQDAYNDYERKLLDNVDEHGWFCVHVFDPDGREEPFSYSVGFTKTLGAPEFIVFGLPRNLMHSMLWEVFRQIKAGKTPADNQRWSDLIEGFECVSRAVHSTNMTPDYLSSAIWFWKNPSAREGLPPAFQIVWPGRETGHFPWDKDCPEDLRVAQPPLWLPNRSLS